MLYFAYNYLCMKTIHFISRQALTHSLTYFLDFADLELLSDCMPKIKRSSSELSSLCYIGLSY